MHLGLAPTSVLLSNLRSPQKPAYLALVYLSGAGKSGPVSRWGCSVALGRPQDQQTQGVRSSASRPDGV